MVAGAATAVVVVVDAADVEVKVWVEVGPPARQDGSNTIVLSNAHRPDNKRRLRVRIAALVLGLVAEVDGLAVDAGDGEGVHLLVGCHADRAIDAGAFLTDHVIVACR